MNGRPLKIVLALVVVAIVVAALSNLDLPPRCTPLKSAGAAVSIELSRLERGQARLFCYRNEAGDKIRFILARGSDGAVHSVFDACRQCYSYRKGYRLNSNGSLVCRLCGNRYSVDRITTGKASCAPVPLRHQESGSTVRISTSDMQAGRSLF